MFCSLIFNSFVCEWKLNLVMGGASSKKFEKPWLHSQVTFRTLFPAWWFKKRWTYKVLRDNSYLRTVCKIKQRWVVSKFELSSFFLCQFTGRVHDGWMKTSPFIFIHFIYFILFIFISSFLFTFSFSFLYRFFCFFVFFWFLLSKDLISKYCNKTLSPKTSLNPLASWATFLLRMIHR